MKRARGKTEQNERHSRPRRRPLPLHPLFAAVLGLWGAALGGLVTLVLPRAAVQMAAGNAGLGAFGTNGAYVLAALAALVLGGALYALAGAWARMRRRAAKRADAPSIAALAMRHVRTIDPANDLGSRSLDEPVATMPFASLSPDAVPETPAEAEAQPAPAPAPAEQAAPPVALDLAQFAALPGRNAVWVEAPVTAPEPQPEPVAAAPVRLTAPASPSAIEHLRAVPTSELSLVQMVERFAAALHEHQSAPPSRAGGPADQAGREAALAEALKALAAFTPQDNAAPQSEPLRAALTRLQELRGAA